MNKNKKSKAFVLEVFFKDENDLKTFVEEHFKENGHNINVRLKDGWDTLHLRSYTKKVYVMKPTDKMDSMAHLWIKPNSTLSWREQLQKELPKLQK